MKKRNLLFIVCSVGVLCGFAQKLEVVVPDYGTNNVHIQWKSVNNATSYEVQRSALGSGNWTTVTNSATTNYTDAVPSVSQEYEYRVKANNKTNYSSTRRVNFKQLWPVGLNANSCGTESIELLHDFHQPIGGKNGTPKAYLHEGIDIQGEQSVIDECVIAPFGGVVTAIEQVSNSEYRIILRILFNGQIKHIGFSHVTNNKKIKKDMSVYAGEKLTNINPNFPSGWTDVERHTHMQAWTDNVGNTIGSNINKIYKSTINPLTLFDNSAYQDPKGQAPQITDMNGDNETIRFKKGPHSLVVTDYFAAGKPVYNAVDIVAEIVDRQSKDAPFQAPKKVGYSIDYESEIGKVTVVPPHVLIDGSNWFTANSPNYFPQVSYFPEIMDALVDHDGSLETKIPQYEFHQWFTYIVTNTKGNTGSYNDLGIKECWATRAPIGSTGNGYSNSYDQGTVAAHQFKDGKYFVTVTAEDLTGKQASKTQTVVVDNFQPYIKRLVVKEKNTTNVIYDYEWIATGNTINAQQHVFKSAIPGYDYTVEITASEPMNAVTLTQFSCIPNLPSLQPVISKNNTVFTYTLLGTLTASLNSGTQCTFSITGSDYAYNALKSLTDVNATYSIAVRNDDLPFTGGNNPDKAHVLFFDCGNGRALNSGCLLADFSFSPQIINPNCKVTFKDLSFPVPSVWEWDFGDGSSKVFSQHPNHFYTQTGIYTVTLKVTKNGVTDTEQKTITVTNNLIVDFMANKTIIFEGESVTFGDVSSSCNGITNRSWDFGDGVMQTVTTSTISHTYNNAGFYSVLLIVNNGQGQKLKLNYIEVKELPALTITCPGDMQINANQSIDVDVLFSGGTPPYDVSIKFGNQDDQDAIGVSGGGYTFTTSYPTYLNNQIFNVSADITDANGETNFCNFKITVGTPCLNSQLPVAVIADYSNGETIDMCEDYILDLISTSSNANTFKWSSETVGCGNLFVGCDENTGTGTTYSFDPQKGKKYKIFLNVTNECGLDIATLFVNVKSCEDKIGSKVFANSSNFVENTTNEINFEAYELEGINNCQPTTPTYYRESLWQKTIFGGYDLYAIKCAKTDYYTILQGAVVNGNFQVGEKVPLNYFTQQLDHKTLWYKNNYKLMFEVWDEKNFKDDKWTKGSSSPFTCAPGYGLQSAGDLDAQDAVKNVYKYYEGILGGIFKKPPCFHEANFYSFKVIKCKKFKKDENIGAKVYKNDKEVLGNVITAPSCNDCNVIVKKDAEVNYIGQTKVHLRPGFRSDFGSKFHAWIEPACNNGFNRETDTVFTTPDVVDTVYAYEEKPEIQNLQEKDSIPQLNTIVPVMKLYPNPTKSILNIEVVDIPLGSQLLLYNPLGVIVKDFGKIGGTNRFEFVFSEQANGIYYVKLVKESTTFTKKVAFVR